MIHLPAWKLPEVRKAITKAENLIPTEQRGTPLTIRHAKTLRRAPLWMVTSDMTQLAIHTSDSLPPWTPAITRPTDTGFIFWDSPIGVTHKADGFDEYGRPAEATLASGLVQLIHWSLIEERLNLTLYGQVTDDAQRKRSRPLWQDVYELGVYTVPAMVAFDPSDPKLSDPALASMIHVIGATWLLMLTPTVSTQRQLRSKSKGSGAKRKQVKHLIQIIDLRQVKRDKTEKSTTGEGKEYHFRWAVRGHWRQQRVGPGRKMVKPVFVSPHIRGPEHAPLKTDTVHVWRR